MSSETILPPEGPEGPKKQLEEETNPLLSKSTGKRRDIVHVLVNYRFLCQMYISGHEC